MVAICGGVAPVLGTVDFRAVASEEIKSPGGVDGAVTTRSGFPMRYGRSGR